MSQQIGRNFHSCFVLENLSSLIFMNEFNIQGLENNFEINSLKQKERSQKLIIPNYNQQDAPFLNSFISTDAVHDSGGSSVHYQEHITVHTASGNVQQYCFWLLSMERSSISSTIAASSSIGGQYLKLYVQLCAPDDGRRNRVKLVERL